MIHNPQNLIFLSDEIESLLSGGFRERTSNAPGASFSEHAQVNAFQQLARDYRPGLLVIRDAGSSHRDSGPSDHHRLEELFVCSQIIEPDSGCSGMAVDFQAAVRAMGFDPGVTALVSSDFQGRIVDAGPAGLNTVWINPGRSAAPGLLPVHHAEAVDLLELSQKTRQHWSLPGIRECRSWYQKERFSATLWMHVHMVAAVAYQLAVWLREAGVVVDPLLVHRGALLHDLAKLSAQGAYDQNGQPVSHGELAARRLACYGQPVLAEIARRHMLFCVLEPDAFPGTEAQKLVYFADKLVEGAGITGYGIRMAALKERYPEIDARLEGVIRHIEQMQSAICSTLGCSSEALIHRLQEAARGG